MRMKRGSDVGSRQKRSSNDADELCAMPRSSQLTVTSKTWRKPAMNGARKGPSAAIAFGVRYQFLNGTIQPDRLNRLPDAADHERNARPGLRDVGDCAGLPLP